MKFDRADLLLPSAKRLVEIVVVVSQSGFSSKQNKRIGRVILMCRGMVDSCCEWGTRAARGVGDD